MTWWQQGPFGCRPCAERSDFADSDPVAVVELWPSSSKEGDRPRTESEIAVYGSPADELLPWSDDTDIWNRDVEPTAFEGSWVSVSDNMSTHIIKGSTLQLGNGPSSDLSFCGAQLQLLFNGKGMFAFLDKTDSKLQWSDGEVWEKIVEPNCDPTDFRGSWANNADNGSVCMVRGTTVSWSDGRISSIIFRDGKLQVTLDGNKLTASLDATKANLLWSDGVIWSRPMVMDAEAFEGSWEDSRKKVHTITAKTVTWSTSSSSQIKFGGGKLHVLGMAIEATATLDSTKAKLVWSHGDIWNKTVDPAVLTGACRDADPAEFAGAWMTGTGSDANVYIVAVADQAKPCLKWASDQTSEIVFDGGRLSIPALNASAILDAAKAKLEWSNGDVWYRAGFQGYWNKAGFDGSWKLDGASLIVLMRSGQTWSYPADAINPSAVNIKIENQSITGSLDKNGMVLTWSNSDVWERALRGDTPFK